MNEKKKPRSQQNEMSRCSSFTTSTWVCYQHMSDNPGSKHSPSTPETLTLFLYIHSNDYHLSLWLVLYYGVSSPSGLILRVSAISTVKLPMQVTDKREPKKFEVRMEAEGWMPDNCDIVTRIIKNKEGKNSFYNTT